MAKTKKARAPQLTAEQAVDALRVCANSPICAGCPFNGTEKKEDGGCMRTLMRAAVTIIDTQKTVIAQRDQTVNVLRNIIKGH